MNTNNKSLTYIYIISLKSYAHKLLYVFKKKVKIKFYIKQLGGKKFNTNIFNI